MFKAFKKAVAICVAAACLAFVFPAAGAGTPDSAVMDEFVSNGLVDPKSDIFIKPWESIRKVEFYSLINRLFGYAEKAKVHFSDVLGNTWYGDEIARAVAAGYLEDEEKGRALPFAPIYRAEAAVILAKVFNLKASSDTWLDRYADKDRIPEHARDAVNALAEKGYADAQPGGNFAPWSTVSRHEAVEWIAEIMGALANKKGIYSETAEGNLVVNTSGVTLRNMTVKGDLYLAEGIGSGSVVLDRVTVRGRIIVRGGGDKGITIRNSTVKGGLLVLKKDGNVRIIAEGSTALSDIQLCSGALLEERKITREGFENIQVVELPEAEQVRTGQAGTGQTEAGQTGAEQAGAGQEIRLIGSFADVTVEMAGAVLAVDGSVSKLNIGESATGTELELVNGNIDELNIQGGKSYISLNGGTVTKLSVQETATAARIVSADTVIKALDAKTGISAEILSGVVERFDIGYKAKGSHVRLGSGAVVRYFYILAGLTVRGYGRIDLADIYADNVTIEQRPISTYIQPGIKAVIGGTTTVLTETVLVPVVGDYTVREGETIQIMVTVLPPEAGDVYLVLSSADSGIAIVDSANRKITGISAGTTTMYAIASKPGYKTGFTAFTVTVVPK